MRVRHITLIVVALVVGFGAKQFLFSSKDAVADANPRAGMDISKMHRESAMHNIPVQTMHDMTLVFDSE